MNRLARIWMFLIIVILGIGTVACGNDDDDANDDDLVGDDDDSGGDDDDVTDDDDDGEDNLFWSDRVLNIAHRGGRSLRPEHSLLAYQHALDVGADVLELDLHSTSDGVIVAIHDHTVDRTTDGTGEINSMTIAEIKMLDAGYNFSKDGGETYPYRGQGIEVPTLEEIVAAFPDSYFVIEVKQGAPSLIADMLAILEGAGLAEKVVLGSFIDSANIEIREINPDVKTNMSMGEVLVFWSLTAEEEAAYSPPGMFHQVPIKFQALTVLDQAYADRAKRLGMKVHAWTINDADEMRRLIDMGVDGIITDDPVTLESVLAEYGIAE